jgi:heptosyltransferase-2
MKKQKVLIIKTGYSEILDDRNNSRKVSLGDVLRTTPLLHLYRADQVTWVTDIEAFPLLEGNPFIHRLLPYDFTTALQLESEEYDVIINLEKTPGICAMSDNIKARRTRYGFTFNSQTGDAEALNKALGVLTVSSDIEMKRQNKKTAEQLLFGIVGRKWNGEEYVLGYKPKTEESFDIGLNTKIGQKWPTKAWSDEKWNALEKMLQDNGFSVTRQDRQSNAILTNLNSYMDWINSSRLLVSNDSLGMHLAIALKKTVLGLFGPTQYAEVHFYGRGKAVLPAFSYECIPCFEGKCKLRRNCMEDISVEKVYGEIQNLTSKQN